MGKAFSEELDAFNATLRWCVGINREQIPSLVVKPDAETALCVAIGSGGSFSAADYCARAWQQHTGRLGLAMTPLEYMRQASTIGHHRAYLLSAEGKNTDILAAAATALSTADEVSLLTFRTDSPLLALVNGKPVASVALEGPWAKDGYLATNSLVASISVLASQLDDPIDASKMHDAGAVAGRLGRVTA